MADISRPSPDDNPIHLLKLAKRASPKKRSVILNQLAHLLASTDLFTIDEYANEVKTAGLTTKRNFLDAVRKVQKAASRFGAPSDAPPTDDELGDLWLKKVPATRYGLGEYRRYDNGTWLVVPEDSLKAEIVEVLRDAKVKNIRPTKRLLESVAELSRVRIAVPKEKWDAYPDYIPFRNGVLYIPTRELLPHHPDYFFTSGLCYDYDPNAVCPNFRHVVEDTIPSANDFVQEFAGYALTTDTRYELAIWFYGPPGSGRSTILTGFQAMLGGRVGSLGLADIERSRFALTNIPGKTLLISTEQPSMYFTATHILNAIISGETIEVDRKYRDPVQIEPRAKMVWAMPHRLS